MGAPSGPSPRPASPLSLQAPACGRQRPSMPNACQVQKQRPVRRRFNGTDGWKCHPWGGGLVKSSHRIEELVINLPTNLPKNAQLNVGKYT